MKFAIQHNLINANQLLLAKQALTPYPHVPIGVIPFSKEITSEEPLEGKDYIPYGSTLLITLAAELGWTGLHFDLSKLNYKTCLENTPHMLNGNVISALAARDYLLTVKSDSEWFIRPNDDLKQFSGCVMPAGEIAAWLTSMMESVGGGTYYMSPDALVVLCTPKTISAEWRWFIVNGKIVSGSMYRAHGQLNKVRETDKLVIDEAQHLADTWLPMGCVVMDTALVGNYIKILEFNCINASGFYNHDMAAIFDALWKYHEK